MGDGSIRTDATWVAKLTKLALGGKPSLVVVCAGTRKGVSQIIPEIGPNELSRINASGQVRNDFIARNRCVRHGG